MLPAQPAIGTDADAALATAFAERLGAFVKNAFVYPDNNQRVQASLADALAALRACCRGRSTLILGVIDTGLSVDGATLAAEAAMLAWLRATLVTSRVGVVAFELTVEKGAVLAWARHLQRAHGDRAASYATIWGGAILPGILVREFMLAPETTEAGEAGSATVDAEPALDQVKARLSQNTRIASELKALQKLLAKDSGADAEQASDLLDELVSNLSAEAIADPDYAAIVAERVLSSVRRTLMADTARSGAVGITQNLVELGRKLFPRIDTRAAPIVAAPGRGHGDEHITDDPVALRADLAEVEAQQAATRPSPTLTSRGASMPGSETSEAAEVAGILLHTLSTSDRLSTDSLRERLLKQSLIAGPAVKATICAYLSRVLDDDARGGKPDRLQTLAHSLDARGMLRTCGFLDADAVAADFPRRVPLLVEACTVDQSALVLADVARTLGQERILAAETWFAANRTMLAGERVTRLLAAGGASCLPFAILALRHSPNDCRGAVADFLRSLGPTDPVAAVLSVADPQTRLPRDYLELLAYFLLEGGEPEVALVQAAGRALRHAAQDLGGHEAREQRRLACLRAMKDFESDELRAYLRELARARRFIFRREPRAVRQVVREVLRGWRKR